MASTDNVSAASPIAVRDFSEAFSNYIIAGRTNKCNNSVFLNTTAKDSIINLLGETEGTVEISSDTKPDISRTDDKEKPFILNNDVVFNIIHTEQNGKKNIYKIKISKGYKWDGASIPNCLQWLTGKNDDSRYVIPSLVHDYLCENHSEINNDRKLSSNVFKALLKENGVDSYCANIMSWLVDAYQYCFSDWNSSKNNAIIA